MKLNNEIDVLDLPEIDELIGQDLQKSIVVYNDDHNSFDHVIKSFVQILKHGTAQAEQCAHLIHFKGKCGVKSGSHDELKPFKDALVDRGLSAVIE